MVSEQDVPEPLCWIEFRRVRMQKNQAHAVRNLQLLALVGRDPVETHDDEVLRMGGSHLKKESLHVFRVYCFGIHEFQSPILGTHHRRLVHGFANQVQIDHGSKGELVPSTIGDR